MRQVGERSGLADPTLTDRTLHALTLTRLRFFCFAVSKADAPATSHYARLLLDDLANTQVGLRLT